MYSLRVNYFTLILLWIILLTINYCQVEVITDLQPSKSNFRPTFFTVFFFFEQIFTVILCNIIACWSRFRFFHQIILEISQLHNLIPCVRLWVINNFHPISTTNYTNSSLFFNTHSRTNPPPHPLLSLGGYSQSHKFHHFSLILTVAQIPIPSLGGYSQSHKLTNCEVECDQLILVHIKKF